MRKCETCPNKECPGGYFKTYTFKEEHYLCRPCFEEYAIIVGRYFLKTVEDVDAPTFSDEILKE